MFWLWLKLDAGAEKLNERLSDSGDDGCDAHADLFDESQDTGGGWCVCRKLVHVNSLSVGMNQVECLLF